MRIFFVPGRLSLCQVIESEFASTGSINYPFDQIQQHLPDVLAQCKQDKAAAFPNLEDAHDIKAQSYPGNADSATDAPKSAQDVFVVCRRGNDSQHVVQLLHQQGIVSAQDLIGGLTAWSKHVDCSFPTY